jgi:hypothetical protein
MLRHLKIKRAALPALAGLCLASVSCLSLAAPRMQVAIQGLQGSDPNAVFTPNALSFGGVNVGSNLGGELTLTNTGTVTLGIGQPDISGPFSSSTDCPASLIPGAHCKFEVEFAPGAEGPLTGAFNLPLQGLGPLSATLSGTGLQGVASVGENALAFGAELVGQTSGAQGVQLSNSGNANLSVSINVSGDYQASQNCPGNLTPNQSCNVNVVFTPTTTGPRSGSLTINTPQGQTLVSLNGTGTQGVAQVSPGSLTFGTTTVGSASSSQSVTLSNTGTGAFTLTGAPSVSGPYSLTGNTCASSVAAGAACAASVAYVPTAGTTQSGTLSFRTSLGTKTVTLTGTGFQGTPVLAGSPHSLSWDFSDTGTGELSGSSTVTLSNAGTATLSITSTSVTSALSAPVQDGQAGYMVSGCGAGTNLAPGQTCQLNVTCFVFQPGAGGGPSVTGTATVQSTGGNLSVSLSCTPGLD